MLNKLLKSYKNFGVGVTNALCWNKMWFKLTKKQKFRDHEFAIILKYLDKNYGKIMVDATGLQNVLDANYKVWIFWWQGFTAGKVPAIVEKCVAAARKNFPSHEVVLISQDNYQEYTDIPKYIVDKLSEGIINLTHFSDIVRASLLAKWGGVWLDATVYMTNSIEDDIAGLPFYANKLPRDGKYEYAVDKANWSAFFLARGANNPIFVNLKNILYAYWQTHTMLINYFLIDYCIKLSYDKFENVRIMIDQVPINNVGIHDLQPLLNDEFDQQFFENLTAHTKLFKLTYKLDFTKSVENSFYNYLINN